MNFGKASTSTLFCTTEGGVNAGYRAVHLRLFAVSSRCSLVLSWPLREPTIKTNLPKVCCEMWLYSSAIQGVIFSNYFTIKHERSYEYLSAWCINIHTLITDRSLCTTEIDGSFLRVGGIKRWKTSTNNKENVKLLDISNVSITVVGAILVYKKNKKQSAGDQIPTVWAKIIWGKWVAGKKRNKASAYLKKWPCCA